MKEKPKWVRIIYIFGVIALLIGAIDPMEGSVVIAAGSVMLSLSTYFTRDRHWKVFAASTIMILIGVSFLFYLSSLGGIGGNSSRSWWWGTLILPYPLGWLMTVVVLILRTFKMRNSN
jgi:hypothetical protein